MKTISVSVAKNTLSALLRKVRGGATVTITDRGVPVARLVPPVATGGVPARVIDLAERGVIMLPEREPAADWDRGLPAAPRLGKGISAVDALLEERRSGR